MPFHKIIDLNWHEYVDLGLPSGNLWATCDVGASRPEEPGPLFQWEDLEPKFIQPGQTIPVARKKAITDIASAYMGGSWVMPSRGDVRELIYNTEHSVSVINGQSVLVVTSRENHNYIILPLGGYRSYNGLFVNDIGLYWTNQKPYPDGTDVYCYYATNSGRFCATHISPLHNCNVRGVIRPPVTPIFTRHYIKKTNN